MAEWLAQNHEWVLVLALVWVVGGIYFIIKNRRSRSRKSVSTDGDTSSLIDMVANGTGPGKQAGFGGGSGGGGGSTRSFLPTNAAKPEAGELGRFAGVVAADPAVAGTVPVPANELINPVSQATPTTAVDSIPETGSLSDIADAALATVGDAAEATVEVVGAVVSELLKSSID